MESRRTRDIWECTLTVQHLKIRARCSYSESGPFLKQSEEKLSMGSDLPGLSLLAAFFKSSGVILDTFSKCAMFTSASARSWTALSLSPSSAELYSLLYIEPKCSEMLSETPSIEVATAGVDFLKVLISLNKSPPSPRPAIRSLSLLILYSAFLHFLYCIA